jgi:putative redox protein
VRLERQPPQGKISTIALELILGGGLDEGQRQRLTQIAERCPVHRTLTESVRIIHA